MNLFACLALAAASVGAGSVALPQAAIHVHVTDSLGKSLPGAIVTVRVGAEHTDSPVDANGMANILLRPIPLYSYRTITAFAPGHAPAGIMWQTSREHPLGEVPASVDLALPVGTTISGVIRNEEGEAIAGAKVRVFIKADDAATSTVGVVGHSLWDYPVLTDSHGIWRCDMAPGHRDEAYIMPSHPDYYAPDNLTEFTDVKSLNGGMDVAVLTRGRSISGRVVGPDGDPVGGALVECGSHLDENDSRETTAADGTFHISHASLLSMHILATAAGRAPALAELPAGNVSDFVLKMPQAVNLHGRVVDEAGSPVADVMVTFYGWGKSGFYVTGFDPSYTNASGEFEIDNLPAGITPRLSFFRPDFETGQNPPLKSFDQEQLITLKALSRVSGRVTDAATGKPIPRFRILTATDDSRIVSTWEDSGQSGKNGLFDFLLDEHATHRVRIEATGYLPAWSKVLDVAGRRATFDAALTAAPEIAGNTVDPEGKPVSGAHIILLAESCGWFGFDQQLKQTDSNYHIDTHSDTAGRFLLPPPGEKYEILVLHDAGYAVVSSASFETSHTIRLQGWSKISGTVREESGPVVEDELFARDDLAGAADPAVGFEATVKTDALGHYSMEHVPAGVHAVLRVVDFSDQKEAGYQSKTFTTEAGQTIAADFGTNGRDISGVVALPDGLPDKWQYLDPALVLRDESAESPSRMALTGSIVATFARGATRAYAFSIRPDGSFRIPAVEPGKYTLIIQAGLPLPSAFCGTGEVLAESIQNVNVSPADKPAIDLGRLTLTKSPQIAIGEAMPDIQFPTLDNGTIRLADYHGKCLVLCFWASWCGPCIAEMPALQSAYEQFKNDNRFRMIGVSLDESDDAARAAVQKHGLVWPQARLAGGFDDELAKRLNIAAVPSIWIVGPNGKVLYKQVLPELLQTAMTRAVAQPLSANP